MTVVYVTQDGADFYWGTIANHPEHNEGYATYPHHVSDFDMIEAGKARTWFVDVWCPEHGYTASFDEMPATVPCMDHSPMCGNCERDLNECKGAPCTMTYPVCRTCAADLPAAPVRKWSAEFPDFADMPAVPAEWLDVSWNNDACPCFVVNECSASGARVEIWIDYAEPARREVEGSSRFSLLAVDAGGNELRSIYSGDDWSEALRLAQAEIPVLVGNTTRACYWKTSAGYVATGPDARPSMSGGGYGRLDSIMRLKGESTETINRLCDTQGKHKESN